MPLSTIDISELSDCALLRGKATFSSSFLEKPPLNPVKFAKLVPNKRDPGARHAGAATYLPGMNQVKEVEEGGTGTGTSG